MKLDIPPGNFDGLIFDCDGTLANTMPLHYRAWVRLLAEFGGTLTEQQFYQLGGKPTVQILKLLRDQQGLRIDDVERAAERKEEYFLDLIREVTPIDAVVQIARRWQNVKPMAVASGGYRRQIDQTLDALGIRSWFNAIICVEDYVRGKPAPDPFLEAARQLEVLPRHCLVFEDSPLGIEAAKAAGMQYVLVPRAEG